MRTTLLALVGLMGCTPAYDTVCGQRLDDLSDPWLTVEALQEAETAFVGGALLVAGDARVSTPGEACRWLQGLRVMAMPAPTWVDQWGRTVSGIAYVGKDWSLSCHAPGGFVMIGRADSWRASALVHEWLHVVEGGTPAAPCAPTDDYHCGWDRVGGEYALVDALSR